MGDFDAAQRYLDLEYRAYDPTRHHSLTYIFTGHDPGTCCRNRPGQGALDSGLSGSGRSMCSRRIALGETVSHTFSWLWFTVR